MSSRAEIALYFDWDTWWGLTESHGLPRNDFDYPALVTEHYRPLLLAQHAVDMVGAGLLKPAVDWKAGFTDRFVKDLKLAM